MKLRERGKRVSGTDKRTLFPSIDELQLVYSCATFLTVSQVTKLKLSAVTTMMLRNSEDP